MSFAIIAVGDRDNQVRVIKDTLQPFDIMGSVRLEALRYLPAIEVPVVAIICCHDSDIPER
jgi:hypothetical protein